MLPRSPHLPNPPDRAPYLRVQAAGRAWVLRLGRDSVMAGLRLRVALPAQRVAEAVQRADELNPDAFQALVEAAEAARGYVLLRCWADPNDELEARTAYDAGAFATVRGVAPVDAAGLAAVDELMEAGWTTGEIAAACAAVLRAAEARTAWIPSEDQVRDAEDFSAAARPAPTSAA